jgi:arylsulfatase A-like enzyme
MGIEMKRITPAAIGGALLTLLLLCSGCRGERDERPNVLLLSIDTLNRSAVGAFDDSAPALPALDGFATECLRFQNAHSTSSWTLPAHASLLTGLYPDRHGATDRRVVLSEETRTLAEELAEQGYETVGFTGGAFLDPKYGIDRGFGEYESTRVAKGDFAAQSEAQAKILDRCVEFLSDRDENRPFFLFAQTYIVHNYYDARPEARILLGWPRALPRAQYVATVTGRVEGPGGVWRQLRHLYNAEVALLDASFAGLLECLEREELLDSTIIAFVSDHGEGFDPAAERIHHGGRLHADVVRIPMLLRVPGERGRDVTTAVSLIDVVPTIVELVGGVAAEDLDGRSLVPLFREGGEFGARSLFAMEHALQWTGGSREFVEVVQAQPLEMALIRGDRWYIQTGTGEEMYAIEEDPYQRRDLSEEGCEQERELVERRRRDRPDTNRREEDAGLTDQLDDLGYGG